MSARIWPRPPLLRRSRYRRRLDGGRFLVRRARLARFPGGALRAGAPRAFRCLALSRLVRPCRARGGVRRGGSTDCQRPCGEIGAGRPAVELAPFPLGERVVLGPGRKLRRLDADRAVDHQLEELLDRIDEGRPGVDRKQRQAKRRSRVRQVDGRADSLAERSLDRGAMVRLVRDAIDVDDEVGRIISMRIEIEMKQEKELKRRSVRRGTILLDEPVGQQAGEGVAPGAGQRCKQHV